MQIMATIFRRDESMGWLSQGHGNRPTISHQDGKYCDDTSKLEGCNWPRRTLFISAAPFISGAEKSLQIAAMALTQKGVEVFLASPRSSPLSAWWKENKLRWLPCEWDVPSRWRRLMVTYGARQLVRFIEKYSIDLVHSNQVWTNAAAASAALVTDIPAVCHIRDNLTTAAAHWYLRPLPTALICVSAYLKACLLSYNRLRKIQACVIYDPVLMPPESCLKEREAAARRLRLRYGIPRSHRLLLFAGQLIPQKGISILADALRMLEATPVHIFFVGIRNPTYSVFDEPTRKAICSLVDCGKMTLLSTQADLGCYLNAIDLAIVPSLEEPLGRIALEAASYGVPAIVSDIDGLGETVVAGVTGWRIRPGDAKALAEAVQAACHAPLSRMGELAREYVKHYYSAEHYAEKLLTCYRYALGLHRELGDSHHKPHIVEQPVHGL